MSSTVAPTATTTGFAAGATCNVWEIPVEDASCGMPFGGNHTDIMSECCGKADVVSYRNDCGLYCLAIGK